MELCVADIAPGILKKEGVCECENCLLDVMSMALNNLPPKYFVTVAGSIFTRLDMLKQQYDVDITMELMKAVEKVKDRPRH
jgi:competence protein ComFB